MLIEEDLVPPDVTIQVITQAREHLIRRTFESIRGARQAIVHLYNSTSPLQRRVVFGLDKASVRDIAIKGTHLIRELARSTPDTDVRLEYSPESFTGTELEFALEVCEGVMDTWRAGSDRKVIIINLPATVATAPSRLRRSRRARHVRWWSWDKDGCVGRKDTSGVAPQGHRAELRVAVGPRRAALEAADTASLPMSQPSRR
jgi:hypothetical protein